MVSDIRRDVSEVQTAVFDIRHTLKSQEGVDDQHQPVSVTHVLPVAEYTLIVAQAQDRSVISTIERSNVLYLHLAHSVNCLLHHQGSSLDATS